MDVPDYGEALRALHDLAPTAVADILSGLAQSAGAIDVVMYLVDLELAVLTPVPARGAHVDFPVGEPVDGTMAGRAFIEQRLVSELLAEGRRVWVPILEASDCTGVLAFTIADHLDSELKARCEELGLLAGCAIGLAARYTDLYNLIRRRKAMSLPASMQWDLLPPLRLRAPGVTSTGVLEPAYDVGGDAFDHAINGYELDVVICDAMGHGLTSSVTSALTMGAYRHDRREGQTLPTIHRHLDEVIQKQFDGDSFVTGQLARLALRTGRLSWINAGHPPPLLVRRGRVLGPLTCEPSLPWGLGSPLQQQAVEVLEPGDSVLFHTDGVTEGRSPGGEPFGTERLIGLVEQAIREPQPSTAVLRHLVREVLHYQDHHLRDDATLVWVTWDGPA